MRKSTISVILLGISLAFIGCPPPASNQGGGGSQSPANSGGGDTEQPGDTQPAGGETGGEATGGETGGGETAPANTGADISHVKVGQIYVYANNAAPGMKMEMRYKVLEKTDKTIKYEMSNLMDMGEGMKPAGEPTSMDWGMAAETTGQPAQPAQEPNWVGREKLTVSGIEFDCRILETDAAGKKIKTWIPCTGDIPTFPPMLKSEMDGQVTMELTEVKAE